MDIESNVAAVERAGARWNSGSLDGYLELYADDAILRGYAGVAPGLAGIREFYQAFWAAFPNAKLVFEDVFPYEDKVVIRFAVHVVHQGHFQGIPPTGKSAVVPVITILRFRSGKCVERWSQADMMGLLQQLDAM